ncbi:hypothetical protein AFK68_06685 [Hydrocoleum sp. CS-953]|uniref:hypothetical protein n=1 Tax=Hydrocoleum sp. CS-953 TaxID=1671698 RepID=UPI000B9AE99F|nr:hypothetical protein [Hydrocoleum sp. CS-953]OZH55107.1 hypothetical protein AFK68_06685 [Hydrocoleum sp. CS-953]
MSQDSHQQAKIIAKYLNTLIREIEHNPEISPWVVRQVLKTAKDKAEKLADDLENQDINHKVLSNSYGCYDSKYRQ